MRTIAFLSAVLVAAPAMAGACFPANDDTEARLYRYAAPEISPYAGAVIVFGGEDQDMAFEGGKEIVLVNNPCGDRKCYFNLDDSRFVFAKGMSDSGMAVIQYRDDIERVWPADCQ